MCYLNKSPAFYLSKVSGKKYTKQSFRSIYRNSAIFLGYINSFFSNDIKLKLFHSTFISDFNRFNQATAE